MAEKNKNSSSTNILKLKFGKNTEANNKEEEKFVLKNKEAPKNEKLEKEIQENKETNNIKIRDNKNLKGLPQIIKRVEYTHHNNSFRNRPFKKKTFIPFNPVNENKFAIKTFPKKTQPSAINKNIHNNNAFVKKPFNKGPFSLNKPKFIENNSGLFKTFVTPGLEKRNSPDTIKKKKGIKRESTKPKLTMFSNIVGNNFIGKIEDLTLEDSEYYKIRKERKNSFNNKNKVFLAKTIELENEISMKELANKLSMKLEEIERQAKFIGYTEETAENANINIEILEMIATSLGHEVIRKDSINQEKFDVFNIKIDETHAVKRAPIVAIVGHVDHGKTSLLDKIRKSNLTRAEVGGITQKIAAYTIKTKGDHITFIDTPGHASFTNMRQRGINLNDITVLVISAVEGLKDQTIEAIKQIQKSKTQLIIAATKCDLPNINLEKIRQDLSKYSVLVKEYGGDIELVPISSFTGQNIDLLLETILVYADIMNLRANLNCNAIGVVLESKIDAKTGILTTIIVQQGTLKIGDICSTNQTFGKVKRIVDDSKKNIKEATPGMAVEILGLNECPLPGEKFAVLSHDFAVELTKKSLAPIIKEESFSFEKIMAEAKPTLNIILNADTRGGLEALEKTLQKLNITHSSYKILKKSIGKIKDSDLDLSKLTSAKIVNYNLTIDKNIELRAKNEKIQIISSQIIYELEQAIESELEKLVTLIEEEIYLGTAIVKRIFKSSKLGNISGCIVTDGKIIKGAIAKVFRKGILMFKGKIDSLKRTKDDAKEVVNGLECGIFVNYKEINEEDEIFCYKIEFKKPA